MVPLVLVPCLCATMAEYNMFWGAMLGWLVTGLAWRGASWLGAMSLKKQTTLYAI